jgi:hypothetical protein
MSNLTIFKQPGAVSTATRRGMTALGQSLVQQSTMRRIATNTNGTFKRIINGEQIGNAIRGEFNVLPKVSRQFYAGKYDPNAKPTLPDCWSNLGDKPEAGAPNPQSKNCADCKQNIKGSGDNGGRACRFQRRIAILLEGDPTGDVYQFNIPAKSLFGKGTGNVHPFESYVTYLAGNNESPDTVVTNISYDLNADSMELLFTPLRGISDEEYELVIAAQNDPETKKYIQLTVAQADGVTAKPAAKAEPAPQVVRSDEPDDEEPAPAPAPVAAAKPKNPFDADEAEVLEEPVKRTVKKEEAAVEPKADLSSIIDAWGADDEG